MPSTYTSNNKIQKIATGEQSGTWGNTTNTNFDLFDTAIDGFVSITLSGTTHTLNIPDGSAGDGRNKVLVFTGTLAATNTVSVTPNTVKKHYYVQNNTTGGQNIVISQGSGSSVTIKPGYSSIVYLDGAGSGAAAKEVLTSLKLTALLEATGAVLNGSSSGSTTLQASATASGTLTLPAATDTLVGKATTDTFTNKTFDTAGTGNVLRINGTQVSAVTGTGSVVLATSPTLVTPLLGTPTSGTLTNCTGLPVSSGVSGLGTGVATALAVNVGSAGALVVNGGALGTPSSGTLTSCTGLPVSTGISGLGSNVATFLATPSSANLASAVTDETGTGALVFATGPVLTSPTLVTANIGTPALGTLTNCTGLPVSTGISGLGSGVATFLATPSSANLAAAVTDETGTGALVFGTSPTIATPTITTSATVPLVIGGTGTTSTLTLRSTSGVGATGADIIFQTGNNGATEVMRLQNGGNVGIGTSSPAGKLDIVTGVYRGYFDDAAGSLFRLSAVNAANSAYGPLSVNGSVVTFQISASEKMRLDSSGNLLVGTTSALARLTVSAGTAAGAVANITSGQTGTTVRSNSVFRIQSEAAGRDVYMQFSDNVANATEIGMISGSTYFCTGAAERMRIDSSGNVLIGYTTSNGSYLLQVNSQIFATNATIATSDGRYKENISSIKSGLDVVGKLNPVSFTWKQHEIHNFDSGTQVGFIAQDVQAALADEPYLKSVVKCNEVELKDGTKEEFYGLSDAKLIPILVKAIQELKAEIDILKARN